MPEGGDLDAVTFAERFARRAHRGQVDKAGAPYADHCRRVAERVAHGPASIVAWLHDVLEDTDVAEAELRARFGDVVTDAVVALTRVPGEDVAAYHSRVRENELARVVKLADICDNLDPERLAALDPATADDLRRKYIQASIAMVCPAPHRPGPVGPGAAAAAAAAGATIADAAAAGAAAADAAVAGSAAPARPLVLTVEPEVLAVCRLPAGSAVPAWSTGPGLRVVAWARDETSVVCAQAAVPPGVVCESGWRALRVEGPLDFGLSGVLASIAAPLAEASIPIFAVSTYDTDYVLVKEPALAPACAALSAAGHTVAPDA